VGGCWFVLLFADFSVCSRLLSVLARCAAAVFGVFASGLVGWTGRFGWTVFWSVWLLC